MKFEEMLEFLKEGHPATRDIWQERSDLREYIYLDFEEKGIYCKIRYTKGAKANIGFSYDDIMADDWRIV